MVGVFQPDSFLGQSDDVCEYRLDIVNGSTCAIVNATITIYYKLEDDNTEVNSL